MGGRVQQGLAPAVATMALFGALVLTSSSGAPRALFAALGAGQRGEVGIVVASASGRSVGTGYAGPVAELQAPSVLSGGDALREAVAASSWRVDGDSVARGRRSVAIAEHALAPGLARRRGVVRGVGRRAVVSARVLAGRTAASTRSTRTAAAVPDGSGFPRYVRGRRAAALRAALRLGGGARRRAPPRRGGARGDRWHDDAAFVAEARHSLLAERARAVDGNVSVPYWDYTADAALDDWTSARLFDDDSFSLVSSDRADRRAHGRFAFTRVDRATNALARSATPTASCGPLNVNLTPFVGRFRSVLGLRDGYALGPPRRRGRRRRRAVARDPHVPPRGMLHGEAHIMIGGHWGYQTTRAGSRRERRPLLSSKMPCQGLAVCPAYCASDATNATARACPAHLLDEFLERRNATHTGDRAKAVLDAAGVFAFTPLADARWLERPRRLPNPPTSCAVGTPGEMFTSAAPYDPTFWPLHGSRTAPSRARDEARKAASPSTRRGATRTTSRPSLRHALVCDYAADAGAARLPTCAQAARDGHRPTTPPVRRRRRRAADERGVRRGWRRRRRLPPGATP